MRVSVYLSKDQGGEVGALLSDLEAAGGSDLTTEVRLAEDWLAAYRARARPFAIGRTWWIEPCAGSDDGVPEGRCRLVVEPRMAFGTGSHESTHLVLLDLEDDPPVGERFLDVGTGSGILALAAQRLDASWTLGLDIDLQAVFVARQIAGDQDFHQDVCYVGGPLAAVGGVFFDRIVCNMVVAQFMPLVDDIRRVLAPAGCVIFSGILQSEEAEVRDLLDERGLRIHGVRHLGDWLSLRAGHA